MKKVVLAMLAGVAALPVSAQGPVQVGRFDQIELRGGGSVTVRQGAEQRVTMVRGDSSLTGFRVEDRRLIIDACVRTCDRYDPEIEIVMPALDAAAVDGGGVIRAEGGLAPRGSLALAVHGGGLLDFRGVDAPSVAAAVSGGGSIRTSVRDDLAASVSGGGSITYWGNPEVAESVRGGGWIRRGQTN